MKMKTKPVNTTNILLGIIAAEVVFLAAQAIADRQPAAYKEDKPVEQPKKAGKAFVPYVLDEALHHITGFLRRLFSSAKEDVKQGAQRVRERVESFRQSEKHENEQTEKSSSQPKRDHALADSAPEISHEMQSLAARAGDPAWIGTLAAHDGNISLAEAERAVPMPNSASLVERLDLHSNTGGIPPAGNNPPNGKGQNSIPNFPRQMLKYPGVTGDR